MSLRQAFERRFARMLVERHAYGVAFLLRNFNADDFLSQRAVALRASRFLLARQSKGVLIRAAYAELDGHVFRGLRHRIDAVLTFHQRIDETPADGRVVNIGLPRKCAGGLAHHERRARHAFDAACNHQPRFACLDGARCGADRVHTRAAQTVDGCARRSRGQAGQQSRHASHVTVVVTGLIGTAIDHVVECLPVDTGIALDQRPDRYRAEVVGADILQGAAVAADWGANRVANEGVVHMDSCWAGLAGLANPMSHVSWGARLGPFGQTA